ncbi:MAG: fatty acid desaturase [Acidobacteriia bacterium]|nr:fatty acid desaturase [Terriglobia bacterium]
MTDRFDNPASVKGSFYANATEELRRDLATALPNDVLKRLHERTPGKHFAWTGWQLMLLALASAGLWRFSNPLVWIPLALVQGFTLFNFTVLLHEVVHDTVFRERNSRRNRWLGVAYAIPSGISASQFTRWHLDHHAELGSDTDDPKRFRLTPKRNRRWYKLLYFTPALFPIYFRAAAAETAGYPVPLQRRIRIERWAAVAFHLGVAVTLGAAGGVGPLLRVQLLPVFFVFPVAFVINRLGQHYDIDPDDPAKWSTLMKPSWFWDRAYLFSNYHLEHHYFPRVPMYNLRRLHRLLRPFYEKSGIVPHTYGRLLWDYLVLNRKPHTKWADGG